MEYLYYSAYNLKRMQKNFQYKKRMFLNENKFLLNNVELPLEIFFDCMFCY